MPTRIRDFVDGSAFDKFIKQLLAAAYGDNFIVVDDSTGKGDKGVDGYIKSENTLFSAYCPESYDDRTQGRYREKIRADLKKAKSLQDSGRYKIDKWIFVTPRDLDEEANHFALSECNSLLSVEAASWGETRLELLFQRTPAVHPFYPDLRAPDIEALLLKIRNEQLSQVLGALGGSRTQGTEPQIPSARALQVSPTPGRPIFVPEAAVITHRGQPARTLQVRLILLESTSWTDGTEISMEPDFTATIIPPGRGEYRFAASDAFTTKKVPHGMHAYFLGKQNLQVDHYDIEVCASKVGVLFSGRVKVTGVGSYPIFPLCIMSGCVMGGGGFVNEPIELRAIKI